MSGFRLESPIKNIANLSFDRFPTKAMKNVHIVRQDEIVLGKADRGYLIYTTYGHRHGQSYSRYLHDLSSQCYDQHLIQRLLKGLQKLGLVSKEETEKHLAAIAKEQKKKDFKSLCRELVDFTKNDELIQKIAHHSNENLEILLTSDCKKEREFAQAVVRLRKALIAGWTNGLEEHQT